MPGRFFVIFPDFLDREMKQALSFLRMLCTNLILGTKHRHTLEDKKELYAVNKMVCKSSMGLSKLHCSSSSGVAKQA